jgi:hypothetical protein
MIIIKGGFIMYSILIKLTNTSADRYKFLTNIDGSVYTADTLEAVQTKVAELLNDYTLGTIKVVKNCIITNSITVEEVEIQ